MSIAPPLTERDFALRDQKRVMRDTILPPQVQASILRQCPGLSISELENAVDRYRFAEILAPAVPANERIATLQRIDQLAGELIGLLNSLSLQDRPKLEVATSDRKRKRGGVVRTQSMLSKVAEGARAATRDIHPSAGRPLSRKAYIVRDIARELDRCGYSVDASSKGPLVFVATEVLSVNEDTRQDVRSLVRNTLAKMDPNTLDFSQASPP